MRRTTAAGLVAAGLAAAAAIVPAGVAHSTPGGDTIRLYEHDTQQASVDLGNPGPSLGDLFDFSGDIRKGGKDGAKIGRADGACTTTSSDAQTAGDLLCTVSVALKDGQISIQGTFDSGALFGGAVLPLAITGGTGAYSDARGDGTVQVPTDVPDQTDAILLLNLQR